MSGEDGRLMLQGVTKAYGEVIVLRGVDSEFHPGRIGALVGPNGAGKTTLMRIAAGLQRADSGTIHSSEVVYYGGFDTLPVGGAVNRFRRTLGLEPMAELGGRRMSRLSRGQLHRVGLDASFELGRGTLLLDEPWSSLEPDAREDLNSRLVETARSGRVVVVSSHDLDEVARVADDVAFLRDGRAVSRSREELGPGGFDRSLLLDLFRGPRAAQ
ncbi:MAG: ATP-binding cassette domain-containing protein [Acidobacteriota bacterium]